MKKIIAIVAAAAALAVVAALIYVVPGFIAPFGKKGAFDARGNPQVVLFTAKECNAACGQVVRDLTARKVEFQQVMLDGNPEKEKRYREMGGGGSVPYLVAGRYAVSGYERAPIASALAQTYGDKYLTRAELNYYANHFRADGSPLVYMYGASWCSYCKTLRAELKKRKIDYVEVDVELAPDSDAMVRTLEITGYPTTYVGYQRVPDGDTIGPVLAAMGRAGKRRL